MTRAFLIAITLTALLWVQSVTVCAADADNSPPVYQIQPEDIIDIVVWPDQNMSMKVSVRPDGTISYPFIGELDVEGMTVQELTQQITASLAGYVNEPKVAVNVTNIRKMRAFVLGAVIRPGVFEIRKGDTIMDLLTQAGGFAKEAKKSKVAIIRPPENLKKDTGTPVVLTDLNDEKMAEEFINQHIIFVDVAVLLGEGEFPVQHSYSVQDGDIVYVPTGKKMDWRKLYETVLSIYYTFSLDNVIN